MIEDILGYVVGEVQTDQFTFVTSPDIAPPRLEYLVLRGVREWINEKLTVVDVLAQVTKLQVASQILDETLTYGEAETILRGDYAPPPKMLGTATILGYIYNQDGYTTVRVPRSAAMPGQPVFKASDELLNQFFNRNIKSGIDVGTLINRPNVEVSLDPNGLRRHMAIIAQTGAGKSYLSGLVLENLLQLGGNIIIFDPNSDYVCLRHDKDRKPTTFADKVKIFRVPGIEGRRFSDEEIGGSNPYTISFKNLDSEEICDVANIGQKAINIRQAVKYACDSLTALGRDYSPGDLLSKIKEMAGIEDTDGVGYDAPEISSPDGDDPFAFTDALEKKSGVSLPRKKTGGSSKFDDTISGAQKAIKYIENLVAYNVWGYEDVPIDKLLAPMSLSVIDLAGVEQFISEFVVDKTLREIWSLATTGKLEHPVFIVLEEAHNFVPGRDGFSRASYMINRIAAEGRKFKVFLVVITQRPHKINQDTLSQCGSQIIMKLTNPEDQQAIRRSSESLSESLFSDLPGLNVGEAIVLGQLTRIPVMVKVGQRVSAEGGSDIDVVKALQVARDEVIARQFHSEAGFKPDKRTEFTDDF